MKNYDFLILGSNGLLGSNLVKELKKRKINFLTIARSNSDYNLDVKNFKKLKKFFLNYKFKIVINSIAKVSIDYCEKKFDEAKLINFKLVEFLSKMSKKFKFKLVQISTDHVYKGRKFKLNNEKSKIFSINKYAESKILAEHSVKFLKSFLIIRTNFTGRKKNTFIDQLVKNLKKKKSVNLFDDMYTSTIDVKSCAKIIIDLALLKSKGIYNLGARNMMSKKNFAIHLSKVLNLKIIFKSVSSDMLNIPRGKNLGLNVKKIEQKLGYLLPTTKESIKKLSEDYK